MLLLDAAAHHEGPGLLLFRVGSRHLLREGVVELVVDRHRLQGKDAL